MKTILQGAWAIKEGRVTANSVCKEIDTITQEARKIATRNGGWAILYRDANRALWELTFPEGGQHGGGPPRMESLTTVEAESLYGLPETQFR